MSVGRSVGPSVRRSVRQHLFFRRFLGITAPAQPTRLMPGSVSGLVEHLPHLMSGERERNHFENDFSSSNLIEADKHRHGRSWSIC